MAFNMTLDQEEIEKAIDIHVRSLVPGLSPDTKIGISLSATRGPSGFTAAIDLNPTETSTVATATASAPKETAPAVAPKAAPVKVKTSGTKPLNIAAKAAEAKAETAQPVEEAPAAEPAEPAAEMSAEEEAGRAADAIDLNAVQEDPEAMDKAEAEADAAPVTPAPVEEAPAAEAPRQSLFAKLDKPKN